LNRESWNKFNKIKTPLLRKLAEKGRVCLEKSAAYSVAALPDIFHWWHVTDTFAYIVGGANH